jgi:thiosulfate dehydrogenase [quinone] large subunit
VPRSEGGASRAPRGRAAASGAGAKTPLFGAAFALLRIFVGLMFLTSGLEKWSAHWPGGHQMATTATNIAGGQHGTALEGYSRFLTQTVVPHSAAFTWLIIGSEILVGLLLTLGLFSRVAALYALGLNLAYLLGYWRYGSPWQMLNEAFLMLEVAFLMVGPGRTLGLDARLARKRPRWFLW